MPYWNKKVREYLLRSGRVKPNTLHREATRYVSAKAQSMIVHRMMDENYLTEEELAVFRRGRNAKSGSVPKIRMSKPIVIAQALRRCLVVYIY